MDSQKENIDMYIAGSCYCYNENKEGSYITLLVHPKRKRVFRGEAQNTTSYRMLIQAIITGVKKLKKPCIINLYSPSKVGLAKMRGKKGKEIEGIRGKYNVDLLLELKNELKSGQHEINEIITNEFIKSLKELR